MIYLWTSGIITVLAFAGAPKPLPSTKRYGSPSRSSLTDKEHSDDRPRVAIVGGGISGLVVGYVLSQSGKYNVTLLEQSSNLGGNIRSVLNPHDIAAASTVSDRSNTKRLNIGHASHMGMFWNLRLMLRYLGIEEWPVGRGKNHEPGLFRMLSVDLQEGNIVQPSLDDVLSPMIWLEAFWFYLQSYLDPEQSLDEYLKVNSHSNKFLSIFYWSMSTFEFDKRVQDEAGEYALGAARALLITQIFFKFLLCEKFEGILPPRIDSGLKEELVDRIRRDVPKDMSTNLLERIDPSATSHDILFDAPLASYFCADYGGLVDQLASGICGSIELDCQVTKATKADGEDKFSVYSDKHLFEVDSLVFTTQPSIVSDILSHEMTFSAHVEALDAIECGAVSVQICHASDLPFAHEYPPNMADSRKEFDVGSPPQMLGIFDISQLTVDENGSRYEHDTGSARRAGWLSIAYPVYRESLFNAHEQYFENTTCIDKTIYPWIRATTSYPALRRRLSALQGSNKIYITGHTFTGMNKASELQVRNALRLCNDYFGVLPPWGKFISTSLLPDCNDEDAFRQATSVVEAVSLAWKSLVGSFLLLGVVETMGVDILR